jgi:hypothetical protein
MNNIWMWIGIAEGIGLFCIACMYLFAEEEPKSSVDVEEWSEMKAV